MPHASIAGLRRFFFNDTATTEFYTLSLHDALPISRPSTACRALRRSQPSTPSPCLETRDRKSTRLNSSHVEISYAVFCLKKKPTGVGCAAGLLITRHVRLSSATVVKCGLGMARRRRPASRYYCPTSRACVMIPPTRSRSPPPSGGANKPGPPKESEPGATGLQPQWRRRAAVRHILGCVSAHRVRPFSRHRRTHPPAEPV